MSTMSKSLSLQKEIRWNLSGSHHTIVRPRPRSDVNMRNGGPRRTGTLIQNRRGIFSRILIECHGLPLLCSEPWEDSNGVRPSLFHGAQKEDLTSGASRW